MKAGHLLRAVFTDPTGSVSPSLYETARLVALAPWLAGHADRRHYLLAQQDPDGWWGPQRGHRLVPTLSAVEALLTSLSRGDWPAAERTRAAAAADAGIAALLSADGDDRLLPDTVAHELIIPDLVGRINAQLAHHRPEYRLTLPAGLSPDLPERLRRKVEAAGTVPLKLQHSFEAFADASTAPLIPDAPALVGSSPAATAAWIALRGGPDRCPGRARAL
ncbi:prenyltransferase, partial [Kitasatospora sp. NPDC093558]